MKPLPLLVSIFIAVSAAYGVGRWAAESSRSALPATPGWVADNRMVATPPLDPIASARAAQQIARMRLPDLTGAPQALEQWSGRVRVINYWATWCKPCREEMPVFSRLQERYLTRGVHFIGLSIDDAGKVRDYQKVTPVSYPLLIAQPEALALTVGLGNVVQGLPFTLVLDRQGKVAATRLGRYSEGELESLIQTLL